MRAGAGGNGKGEGSFWKYGCAKPHVVCVLVNKEIDEGAEPTAEDSEEACGFAGRASTTLSCVGWITTRLSLGLQDSHSLGNFFQELIN